ncbi:MAG: phosphatase PAP2 family protein [Bacteroidetes bacterium]|nr:phosphatase PAP2 family protein [Bacteroidota bacterium]
MQNLVKHSTIVFFILTSGVPAIAQNPDVRIFRAINNHHTPFSDHFFQFQSNTVKPLVVAAPLGLLATGLIRKDPAMRDNSVLIISALALNFVFTYTAKPAFNRTRPYKALSNVHTVGSTERSASFPSGHTSAAFALATSASLAYPKWYVVVPSMLWAGTVGYSRMAMGMHYPTDVLVGAMLGAGCALLIHHFRKPILRQTHRLF